MKVANVLIISPEEINQTEASRAMWDFDFVIVKDNSQKDDWRSWIFKDRYGLLDGAVYKFQGQFEHD